MNGVSRLGWVAIGLLLVLALVLGGRPAGTRAHAQQEGDLPSSAPSGAGWAESSIARRTAAEPETVEAETSLRIAGSALRPRDGDAVWASGADGGCVYVASGNNQVVFNVPLSLAPGSTVTRLRMLVNDTSAEDCIGWFTAYDWTGHIAYEWAVQSDTMAGETWFDVDIPDHAIDYAAYSYVLNWRPYDTGPGMQLCGFRVFFHPPGGVKYLPEMVGP